MKYIGGPKDGDPLELQPGQESPRGDVTVTSVWLEDGMQERTERHLYRADAFGNLRHVRIVE